MTKLETYILISVLSLIIFSVVFFIAEVNLIKSIIIFCMSFISLQIFTLENQKGGINMRIEQKLFGVKEDCPDYIEMVKIYNLCMKNDVSPPEEVTNFLCADIEEGDDNYVNLNNNLKTYHGNYGVCFEIDLSNIPDDVKKLRMVLSR